MTPFSSFAPDADPTSPGVITEITNMVPTIRGSYVGGGYTYEQLRGLLQSSLY